MYITCIVLPYLHVLIDTLNLPMYYRHWLYLQKTLTYSNNYKELMLIASESPKGVVCEDGNINVFKLDTQKRCELL